MRRYPLIGGATRAAGATLAVAWLIGCAFAPPADPSAVAGGSVTIRSASGARLGYEPPETTIEAPGPVRLRFENRSSLPHNLVFTGELTAATRTIVDPGTADEVTVDLPSAGTYRFVCTIHEGMSGTLIVGAQGRVAAGTG